MSGSHGPYPPINGSNHKRPPNTMMRMNVAMHQPPVQQPPQPQQPQPPQAPPPGLSNQPNLASQHGDLIKYIYESWDKVSRELRHVNRNGAHNGTVAYFDEREQNPMLKDFQPFDLEAWWGQKLVQKLTANNGSS